MVRTRIPLPPAARHFVRLLPVLICLLWCSCQSVLFLLYGIKKPRPVSGREIVRKALELGIDTNYLLCIRPEYYPVVINDIGSFPNARIYDMAGNRYNYRNTPDECKSSAAGFIRDLRPGSTYPVQPDSSFFRLPVQLEGLCGGEFKPEALSDTDFHLFLYWGTFLGKLNREYVLKWMELARENRNARIHLWFVSCDIRTEWGEDIWKSWQPATVPR